MGYIFFIGRPIAYLVIWILHAIGYYGILGKMGLDKRLAICPIAAEKRIGKDSYQMD